MLPPHARPPPPTQDGGGREGRREQRRREREEAREAERLAREAKASKVNVYEERRRKREEEREALERAQVRGGGHAWGRGRGPGGALGTCQGGVYPESKQRQLRQ